MTKRAHHNARRGKVKPRGGAPGAARARAVAGVAAGSPTRELAPQHDARAFHALKHELGRRLRAAREARELTQSEAARAAGVSRRYLTEAEAGRANPSIEVLARLALLLRTPLGSLLDLPLPRRDSEPIALVGLRGAGKTTVGKLLARELDCPFVELDQRVEQLAGLSLAEIFGIHGEAAFQRFEAEALEDVLVEGERVVIALSGSIVAHEQNWRRVREACRTIWLQAQPDEHLTRVTAQGDLRPMQNRPRALEELRALLRARASGYGQCELVVNTSGRTPASIGAELCRLVTSIS